MPRIVESPAGMLNAIGLQNPGIRGFVKKYPPIGQDGLSRRSSTFPRSPLVTTP